MQKNRAITQWLLSFALSGAVCQAAQAAPAADDETDFTEIEVSDAEYAQMFKEAASSAGGSFGAPLAFGANWGDVGAGIYAQTVEGSSDDADGSMGFTFGLGDADRAVGLETSVALSSLLNGSNDSDSFGDAGSFALKLHTALPGNSAFAVGVSSIGRWGGAANDAQEAAVFAVASKLVPVPVWGGQSKMLMVNLGVGNQSYNKFGDDEIGAFGSLAFFFTPQLSTIVDYSGTLLKAAVSWAPFLSLPLTASIGAVNLNGAYDGDPELAASIGYGFQF